MKKDTPVIELKGVGEKTRKLFGKLDIETIGDLLSAYPRDYETYQEPVKISRLTPGETCAVYGAVAGIPSEKRIRKLSVLNVNISDGTGSMQLTFFNMPFLKKVLKQGGFYVFRGTVQSRGSFRLMEQPKIFSLEDYMAQTNCLIPKYSLTKGLTNQAFRKAVRQALSHYEFEEEYYPRDILENTACRTRKALSKPFIFPRIRIPWERPENGWSLTSSSPFSFCCGRTSASARDCRTITQCLKPPIR